MVSETDKPDQWAGHILVAAEPLLAAVKRPTVTVDAPMDGDVEALEDGRYNIVLDGETRFRLVRELDVRTSFRQIEAEIIDDAEDEVLSSVERAGFEFEARRFADMQGYSVDWDSVERLDDETLINGVAQIAPFDAASKQALLEAPNLAQRCELMIQLMQFFALRDDGDEIVTLQ